MSELAEQTELLLLDLLQRVLPVKLGAELPDARIARAGYDPEQVAGEVAIRVVELGMIKDIEHFKADLKRRGLGNASPLTEPKIRIV
jgi:hypothetical protein